MNFVFLLLYHSSFYLIHPSLIGQTLDPPLYIYDHNKHYNSYKNVAIVLVLGQKHTSAEMSTINLVQENWNERHWERNQRNKALTSWPNAL